MGGYNASLLYTHLNATPTVEYSTMTTHNNYEIPFKSITVF